jgi:hypothetical protein
VFTVSRTTVYRTSNATSPSRQYIITEGGMKGLRGFFTRVDSGAVVGVDLAGRLFTRVSTAGYQEVRPWFVQVFP